VFLLAGVVDRTAGRLADAIVALQQAQGLAPSTVRVDVELATTLAWNRNLDRAIDLFRQVLIEFPDDPGARNGLAFALAWQGQLEEARGMFNTMTEQDPQNVSAWLGLGFVERAYFHRPEAEAAYRRVLEIDPGNAEAREALEILLWERPGESRLLPGLSTSPGAATQGEARIDAVYSASPKLTILGGYQRYAFGAASVTSGGGVLTGTRTEDSLEGGVIFRPSGRTTLAASVYTFFSDDMTRAIVWVEGVYAVTRSVSLLGNVRPAFSSGLPQLFAWAAGATVSLASQQQVTARALVASDTELEPRLTVLASYDATLARRLRARVSVAHSSTDERYEFTSVAAGATYLLSPSFGLSVDAGRRFTTAQRSTLLAGILLRY
jgi:tetratricopeptide (TPR) repeat protein